MNERIVLRAAEPTDELFLFRLRKLTTARYLDRQSHLNGATGFYPVERLDLANLMIIENEIKRIGLFKFNRTENRWFIEQIQLLPDLQGKGVGEEVIRAFLDEATRANTPVHLNVLRNNRALRLYERLGFKVASTNEFEVAMIWHPHL